MWVYFLGIGLGFIGLLLGNWGSWFRVHGVIGFVVRVGVDCMQHGLVRDSVLCREELFHTSGTRLNAWYF